MHRQQWPARTPVQVQPQNRDPAASLIPSHSIRHNTGLPRYSKPLDAVSVPSSTSTVASVSRESDPNLDNYSQDANDSRFSTPASGQSAGIINPFDLSAAAPSEPRHVLVRVDGDAGAYLGNVVGRPAPPELNLPTEMDGSRSVTSGDQIQTGWSVDYYGLSRTPREYGNGIGWRSQESEAVADAQSNFGWPRKYVCSMCSLHWKAMPLPAKVIRGDYVRTRSGVCRSRRHAYKNQPNPSDGRRDPAFSRPGCSEPYSQLHYYLDHEGPGNEPCVRGLCQICRPVSFFPDSQPTTHCCPPPVVEPGYLKEIYRCIMDNCPFLTDTRREMKAHLHSPRKNGHKSYLTGLASRIEHSQTLSAIDKEISSRLMLMFNDRDARGQKSISQPINTVLGPEDVSSPAILREHTQWMSYLGLHTPELHRRDFFDSRTNQWYYREYNLDDDFEDACENTRIISYATGRPVKASDFLWR
ncbi:uncharacterized protein ColSpa_11447 [Colletotrichum spaethianum]|uniref:Uncharacterized protein n=1 Tax=Colletotrichum spaethianum TaxID=700344 RepID=A0AA37PFC3_9PEZI|nr:uncharacterized protein ColSpa_11447 [Colletotrichum spaethianum]GKT51266.1 hypothetical protein ColSpa_11447 [Colletotrichum spaethianum]